MDVRVLEYFLRVVELGSINRAAEELGLSQPSLSRWLTLLEHDIGSPLLIRTRKGVHPTDAGQQLAERAQPILRQLDLLRDEVGKTAVSQVALAMPFSMQNPVTVPFIERLAADASHINLRLHEGMSHTIRALSRTVLWTWQLWPPQNRRRKATIQLPSSQKTCFWSGTWIWLWRRGGLFPGNILRVWI